MATESKKSVTPEVDSEKAKALAAALAQIEKQFGKGSIMRLGDDNDCFVMARSIR